MPKFAANLHYLFTELPFMERFAAAARVGFKAVEFQVPYDYPPAHLADALRQHALHMALFDAPMGNWDKGDRGLACIPGREGEFRESLARVPEYARALNCNTVHVMAGVVGAGMDYARCEATYIRNMRIACDVLAEHEVHVVIEPINALMGVVKNGPSYTTQGMHGYFLNRSHHANALLEAIDRPNLSLHLDCYHMQMLEGNLSDTLTKYFSKVRHIQIAGVPGRHEPDVGEINYPHVFALIDQLGYDGWIGCEYRPRNGTWAGLGWARPYGITPENR